jgi:hypothetical protein
MLKVDRLLLGDKFEIKNGVIGTNRDVIFQLIGLMYFRVDKFIKNVSFFP